MPFEQLIEYTNNLYESKEIAVINKRPTPVKVTRSVGSKVMAGFFEKQSTVDFDGVYQGRAIVFEAKSTKNPTRFDLCNLPDHQYEHLEKCHKRGAIAFILISFEKQQKEYLLPYTALRPYWIEYKKPVGKRSMSILDFDIHAYEVNSGRVPLDYLKVVDEVWGLEAC
ncbi:Holliday junction resolvase RecU [Paenibacillus apiarius]|uniref:Holliday junction resolvase RecU n=1 Tax=Paenibacillus apiarius TaxID=46240 RepID=UPI003B3B20B5